MGFGGFALKGLSWFLRIVEFCCAAIILGIFSYFLAALSNHNLSIATYIRAVEGISGAAVLYTIFALLLVCCLGGIAFFSVLGMLLDLAFTGAFIYLAYATREGRGSCRGIINTPLGTGNADSNTVIVVGNNNSGFTRLPSLHTACRLNTACFAVAIVGAVFFFLSIFVEYGLIQHRRKERAFGPSPNNGYTAGSPKRKFWQRKSNNRNSEFADGEKPDALPLHSTPADVRTSYATDATAVGNEPVVNKYGNSAGYGNAINMPASAGAVGSGANGYGNGNRGYGYQTTTTTHTPAGGYKAYNPNNTTGTF